MDSKFSRDEGSGLVDVRALAEQTLAARPKTEPKPDDHDLIPFSALTAFPSMPMQPMLVPIVEKKMPGWVWGVVGGGVAAAVAVVVVLFVRPAPVVATADPQGGTTTPAKVVTAGLATGMGTGTGTPGQASAGIMKAPDSTATTPAAPDTKTAETKAADSKTGAATAKSPDAKGAATAGGDHAAVKKDKAAHEGDTKGTATKTAAGTSTKKNEAPAEKTQPTKEATPAVAVKEGTPASKKEKPASSGDEDLRNLLGLDSETKKVETKAAAANANLPDQLSSGDIRSGMGSLKSRIDGCFSQYKVPGTVTVSTTIGGDGKVQSAKASGALAGSQEADCVTTVVSGARFKKFTGSPMSITYPFILR